MAQHATLRLHHAWQDESAFEMRQRRAERSRGIESSHLRGIESTDAVMDRVDRCVVSCDVNLAAANLLCQSREFLRCINP